MDWLGKIAGLGTRSAACAIVIATAMLGMAVSAQAQDQNNPAVPTAEGAGENVQQENWIKFCGKNDQAKQEICTIVARDLKTKEGQFLASAQIIEVSAKQKVLRVIIPLRYQLPTGVKIEIDKGKALAGRFVICFVNGCFAEVGIDNSFISAMKRGNEMVATAVNMQGRPVPFKFTLAGFTKTYDGAPTDPKVLQSQFQQQQQQQELQSELKRRAEEARKKIQQGN